MMPDWIHLAKTLEFMPEGEVTQQNCMESVMMALLEDPEAVAKLEGYLEEHSPFKTRTGVGDG